MQRPTLPKVIVYLSDIQYSVHKQASGGIDMAKSATRTAPINLRALDSQRSLIDRAATLLGKNRSDFMLETACREAENILLDQRLFLLNEADFNVFMAMLDAPVKDNAALRKLMAHGAPWE